MDLLRAELAEALSELLAAACAVDPDTLPPDERAAFDAAREKAAKALVKNRVRTGRRWTDAGDHPDFFARWRALRGVGLTVQRAAPSEPPLQTQ